MPILRSRLAHFLYRPDNPESRPELSSNLLRAGMWFLFSAPFWITGALSQPELRLPLWALAVAIEYLAPMLLFRVPGLKCIADAGFRRVGWAYG